MDGVIIEEERFLREHSLLPAISMMLKLVLLMCGVCQLIELGQTGNSRPYHNTAIYSLPLAVKDMICCQLCNSEKGISCPTASEDYYYQDTLNSTETEFSKVIDEICNQIPTTTLSIPEWENAMVHI